MAYLLIDSGASGPNGCFLAYIPSSNSIYLMTNADTATVPGSVMPGGAGSLSNGACTVSSGGLATITANTLTLPVAITFLSGFIGTKNVYGLAQNAAGMSNGFRVLGRSRRRTHGRVQGDPASRPQENAEGK